MTTAPRQLLAPSALAIITAVDQWLDSAVAPRYQEQPLAQDWARVTKSAEEAGEAVAALIAWTGQNPRKGACGSREELLDELADVAFAGILAIQHFTKNKAQTDAVLTARLMRLASRVPDSDGGPG